MNGEIIQFLKKCTIFASLENEDDVYNALLEQFEKISLKEGDILFHQADPADFFYILMSGKLAAILSLVNTRPKLVGHVLPGETVGELGSISGEARTLTIKALENSELLRLSNDTFRKLCRQYPSILFDTIHPAITRSQQIIELLTSGDKKKHIAIIPADESTSIQIFEEKLKDTLQHYKKIALLSENDIHSDDTNKTTNVDRIIADAESKNHVIIYLLKNEETPLARACWDKISKIYIVADGNTKPRFSHFALVKLHQTKQLLEIRRELILLYKRTAVPLNPMEWLNQANFSMHHNIRLDSTLDFKRLLRFIRGKAVGLVLSGGGARGWAHLGALKAILEAHIPIDAIGGTSAGSMVAGLYALSENYDETNRKFQILLDATRKIVSWHSICWPAISLFQCEEFTRRLQQIFGKKKLENLWLPIFCTTTNLSQYREAIHHQGVIWEVLRGSVAIPGLVPPMIINGEMHIDGGVINNLPVNTMRDMLGADSKILAVELIGRNLDTTKYHFPPTLTFKEAFLAKLKLGYRDYKFPPFMDTFLQSLLIGSSVKQSENSLAADLLIAPNTSDYSMLRVNDAQRQQLIQIGYDATREKISTWGFKRPRY